MGIKEKKTERIVSQDKDNKSYKTVHVELQKSDIPKIDKLLRYATKKGNVSLLELIITFKEFPNFTIVIEGKTAEYQGKAIELSVKSLSLPSDITDKKTLIEIQKKKLKQLKRKGLSDSDLILKYEEGQFDLQKAVELMVKPPNEIKKAKKK